MTKKKLQQALAAVGATWDTEMLDSDVIQVDAPKGKVFSANNCHTIVVAYRNATQSWLPAAYKEVLGLLAYGLDSCEITDCDVCAQQQTTNLTPAEIMRLGRARAGTLYKKLVRGVLGCTDEQARAIRTRYEATR